MSNWKGRLWTFCIVAVTLALWSTHAASRYVGDTTGEYPSVVPCDAKLAYEAAAVLAEAADIQYKRLNEPEWDKLSYKGNPQINPAEYLRNLRAELSKARQKAAAAGNLTPEQAEKNFQAAVKQYKQVEKQHREKRTQIYHLTTDIASLMVDINKIDAKLGNSAPNTKKPSKGQQERAQKIKEYEGIISATQNKIQGLVGTDDMDMASERVADPKYKDFSSDAIREAKVELETAEVISRNAKIEAEAKLAKAIENARQEAKRTLTEYSNASRELNKLQGSGDDNSANNQGNDGSDELRKERAAKQKEIQDKTTKKAQLGLQKPTQEDVTAAFGKREAAREHVTNLKEAQSLANDLNLVEPWIVARLVRNGTEARMKKARSEYDAGIRLKDARLKEVRAELNNLQAWISSQRDRLKGREQDEEYWQTVAGIKSRASAGYANMEAALAGMDCFPDVSNLLAEVRARRKNAEAIRIGKAVKKKAPIQKKPKATDENDISGWWVWVRGKGDRVPMALNRRDEKGIYRGFYWPASNTKKIVSGRGTVNINFRAVGSNTFAYRYKYPGARKGKAGGIGGGVMTLSGNRMVGPWEDDEGGGTGTWTLERATEAERQLFRSRIPRGN